MTLNGHSVESLLLPHKQEIAAIVTGVADIGVGRCLLPSHDDRAANCIEQRGAVHDCVIAFKGFDER